MTETMSQHRHFLPGMGRPWLLPLYDPLTRALGAQDAHRRLVELADVRPGQRVLEIGCGTGNLLLLVKRLRPGVEVVGLDPDAKALARARRKARREALAVELDEGFADALPYPDAAFDRVLSAFMFHHLEAEDRVEALAEVARVLRPGGSLHLLDFGGAQGGGHDGLVTRLSRRNPRLHDNLGDRVPRLMREAGLAGAAEVGHRASHMGRQTYWAARRPEA
jgi:ubiquinone/menaquinone biosynthesis C-methylase UbiE